METEPLAVGAKTLAERASVMSMLASKPRRNKMPEHSGLPVHGYQPQSDMKVQAVNHNKEMEEMILRVCDSLKHSVGVDQRWLAIGRTHIEEGFMAINRSIFKPSRIKLASDDGEATELDLRKPPEPLSADAAARKMTDAEAEELRTGTPPLPPRENDIVA